VHVAKVAGFGPVMVGVLLLASSASGQVLYRNGRDVPLKPSARFLALRVPSDSQHTTAQFIDAVDWEGATRAVPIPGILREMGIVILETSPPSPGGRGSRGGPSAGGGRGAQAAVPAQFPKFKASAAELGTQLPVYQLDGVDVILTHELIVKPRDPQNPAILSQLRELGSTQDLPRGRYRLRVTDAAHALDISNKLGRDPSFVYSEPNFITIISPGPRTSRGASPVVPQSPVAGVFPSDQLFPQQWSLLNRGSVGNAGSDIKTEKAWSQADGNGVVIAILDDGVDETHPDLKDKIVKPYDATLLAGGGSGQKPGPADTHGTQCAGIAAAITDNIEGIAGVGYKAKIMPVKIASTDERARYWITTPDIIARGIDYAVDHGADVVSASWTTAESPTIEDAINNGLKDGRNMRGVVFVFAAGNKGTAIEWPAKLAKSQPVNAVGATNEWDQRKTRTSRDGETDWASNVGIELTVVAPGVHIVTTDLAGAAGEATGDYVTGFRGTSAAAPHVAGVAALILSKEPTLTAAKVKERLQKSADHLGDPKEYGAGRINACRAVGASGC
jgi:thermitase